MIALPDVFDQTTFGVYQSARACPFRGRLQDSQPDMNAAGNSFERQVIPQIVVDREFLRLPVDQRCHVERGSNQAHIDLQTGRYVFSVCRTSIDFGAR